MTAQRLRIVLSGMVAGDPNQGGATWAVLQYALGLRRLGHDVMLVEPVKPAVIAANSPSVAYFSDLVSAFDLAGRAVLVATSSRDTAGVPYSDLIDFARRADVLINIAGMLTDPELTQPAPARVYLDLDPAFVQVWHDQGIDLRFAGHTHFVTVGLNVGRPDCPVPTGGVAWQTTLQPVVLERWPAGGPIHHNAFTTVGNWRGYGSVEHQGVLYGQKAHSLRPLIDLPKRTRERFLLALAIHPGETNDLAALRSNGWGLADPAEVAGSPAAYQRFIQGSKAEFGVAKSGYVASRCGWFSDRSACYLASGRPVVAQDTGFGRVLPTGEGLFAFTTADDVLAAVDAINGDYARHARAARAIAEEFFDSDVVLRRLLRLAGVAA
jgi:hypothetical protein